MAEKFLTLEEVQERLKVSAEELQRLMEGRELHAVVQGGVIKLSEGDVAKLARAMGSQPQAGKIEPGITPAGGPRPESCPTCFTRPGKKQEDYGFVFLVDEEDEKEIEGESYDGDLPTSTVQTPDEDVLKQDFVDPTTLSAEQEDALNLFDEMDISRLTDMGRKIAERGEVPEGLEIPDMARPEEKPVPESVPEPVAEVEPVRETPAQVEPVVEEVRLHEPVAEPEPVAFEIPKIAPIEPTAFAAEAPAVPEPTPEPEPEETVVPRSEPAGPINLEFVIEESPVPVEPEKSAEVPTPEPTPTEEKIEASDIYEIAEAPQEFASPAIAEQATDEETEDLAPPVKRTFEEMEEVSLPEPEPVEETPSPVSAEVTAVAAEAVAPEDLLDLTPEEPAPAKPVEEPVAALAQEPVAAEVEVPEPVTSAPEPVKEAPAPTMPVEEAAKAVPEAEAPKAQETEIPASEPITPLQDGDIFDEIEKELTTGDGESKAEPVGSTRGDVPEKSEPPKAFVSFGQKARPDRSKLRTEEESVVPEDKNKKKDEEQTPEDIFEVYDVEDSKDVASTEGQEEVVNLEEVAEPAAPIGSIEKSVDDEMADIFGEEPVSAAPTAAPASSDDFDLSIFKETGHTGAEVGTLGEEELSAVLEEPTLSEVGAGTEGMSTADRLQAATAAKGPSNMPMTIAIVVSFVALVVVGMIMVALYYGKMPGGG